MSILQSINCGISDKVESLELLVLKFQQWSDWKKKIIIQRMNVSNKCSKIVSGLLVTVYNKRGSPFCVFVIRKNGNVLTVSHGGNNAHPLYERMYRTISFSVDNMCFVMGKGFAFKFRVLYT